MYLFASFISFTFISNSICNINSLVSCVLLSVTPLHFCTLSPTFASFNILCTFPSLCFLETPASGDAPFPATPALGDAYAWRRLSPISNLFLLSFYPLALHFEWKEDKN